MIKMKKAGVYLKSVFPSESLGIRVVRVRATWLSRSHAPAWERQCIKAVL